MRRRIAVTLNVNGEEADLYIPPNRTLLQVIREELELTGAKESCGEGACGSCTVLCDGRPVRGCLTLAAEVEGREITTIEGLGMEAGKVDPLQQAFIDKGAVQCGFCTPGMIMAARAFLNENPDPDEGAVREAINGNICRCTGYTKIVEAILDAAGG